MRERFKTHKEGILFLELRDGEEDGGVYAAVGEGEFVPVSGEVNWIADQFGVIDSVKFARAALGPLAQYQQRVQRTLSRVEHNVEAKVVDPVEIEFSQRFPE